MYRFIFSIIIYSLIAKWVIAEINILSPSIGKKVSNIVNKINIPTHNQWTQENIEKVTLYINKKLSFIENLVAEEKIKLSRK